MCISPRSSHVLWVCACLVFVLEGKIASLLNAANTHLPRCAFNMQTQSAICLTGYQPPPAVCPTALHWSPCAQSGHPVGDKLSIWMQRHSAWFKATVLNQVPGPPWTEPQTSECEIMSRASQTTARVGSQVCCPDIYSEPPKINTYIYIYIYSIYIYNSNTFDKV